MSRLSFLGGTTSTFPEIYALVSNSSLFVCKYYYHVGRFLSASCYSSEKSCFSSLIDAAAADAEAEEVEEPTAELDVTCVYFYAFFW